jgi:hypothetical protein
MVSVLTSSAGSSDGGVKSDCKIGISCFSARHAALRIKSKEFENQDNVSEWSNTSRTVVSVNQHYKHLTLCSSSIKCGATHLGLLFQ